MTKKVPVQFTLNGEEKAEFVEGGATLLSALREKLGDTSPKGGCHQGTCGACSVLIDGELHLSCLTLARNLRGSLGATPPPALRGTGVLHPLQRAFIDGFATQCGFCTPGMIMAAKALLDHNPDPSRDEVVEALAGNICRCTGYEPIINAVLTAARANVRGRRLRRRMIELAKEYFADQRNDGLQRSARDRAAFGRARPCHRQDGLFRRPQLARACCI